MGLIVRRLIAGTPPFYCWSEERGATDGVHPTAPHLWELEMRRAGTVQRLTLLCTRCMDALLRDVIAQRRDAVAVAQRCAAITRDEMHDIKPKRARRAVRRR
jgi:hypothetical protein